MKTNKYTFLWGFLLLLTACTKDLQSLNENPAGYPDLDPSYQFTTVQTAMSGDREDVWRYDLLITSPMIQHLGGAWGIQAGGMYQVFERNYWASHWEATYPRELKNVEDIIDKTKDTPEQSNIHAAARILRVMIFAKLTDLYGDIPYSEAIKGYTDKVFLPKYDKQEDIYTDLFKELEEAVNQLDPNKGSFKGDIFYTGDPSKWKKLGNSLRLRLGFRLSKVNSNEARKQVEAALTGGVMSSNDDIAMTKHMPISYSPDELRGNGRSQVFKMENISSGFKLTKTLVDYMSARKDPRLKVYGGTYLGDGIIGVSNNIVDITEFIDPVGVIPGAMGWQFWEDYGSITTDKGESLYVGHSFKFVQPSIYVSALDAPFFHFTYAEVELLKAEAAIRGWGGLANPAEHFMKGIEASCHMMTLYPGAPPITTDKINQLKKFYQPFPTDFESQMDAIHGQLWVNFFLNGVEAYSNYRRTGYPSEIIPFKEAEWYVSETNGVMPKRFFYPQSEFIQNPTSLNEAISRLGGKDDWLKPVWWDKQ